MSVVSVLMSSPGCSSSGNWSVFFREWLSSNRPSNQLPISAVCNSRCIFCSNQLNPFPVAGGMFRDVEDVKLQISLMPLHRDPIRMSDSLPGRIAEGEAFLHPRLFDILKLVRRKYLTNKFCFTTNATMLDGAFLKELARFRPIEITVSLHTTRPELWTRIFRKSEGEARIAIGSPPLIREHRIDLAGTIVPLPAICGWEDISRTYSYFADCGAKSMILYWPGYTVRTSPGAVPELAWSMDEAADFVARVRADDRMTLMSFPDTKQPLRVPVQTILKSTLRGNTSNCCGPFRKVLWLTSEAAHGRLTELVRAAASSVSNVHNLVAVKNLTYGGNIVCSGLLTVSDFVTAGKEALARWPDTELILVPGKPFDGLDQDLVGNPAYRIAEELARKVWVIRENGTYDPLLTVPRFTEERAPDVVRRFMADFDRWRQDESRLDQALDLVDGYPLHTSWGNLDREQLRAVLLEQQRSITSNAGPTSRIVYMLDRSEAQCIETWPTPDDSLPVRRWTFLIRRQQGWRVQSIKQGKRQDLCE